MTDEQFDLAVKTNGGVIRTKRTSLQERTKACFTLEAEINNLLRAHFLTKRVGFSILRGGVKRVFLAENERITEYIGTYKTYAQVEMALRTILIFYKNIS